MALDKAPLEKIRNNDPSLTSLNLWGNQIGDASAKDLSDVLKHNNTLTSLDLVGNQIGDAQLKEINTLIERNVSGVPTTLLTAS
jgi:hypothetical protein